MRHVFIAMSVLLVTSWPLNAFSKTITIGDLREACQAASKSWMGMDLNAFEAAEMGRCSGFIINETSWRTLMCAFKIRGVSKGVRYETLDETSAAYWNLSRSLNGHSTEALVQAFLNWTNNNPQYWSEGPSILWFDHSFWAEFPCSPK